jgi:hypothetical protein
MVLIFVVSMPVHGQSNADGSSPQYLFPDFTSGNVKMKNGLSQNARLNLNTVTETVVYEKEGQIYDLLNVRMIDAIIIKSRIFVPVRNIFHEVLLIAPIPLLVRHKGDIILNGTAVGYGGTSQVSNAKALSSVKLSMGLCKLQLPKDFSVKPDRIYLIRIKGKAHYFRNEKQFLRLFPDKKIELNTFIKQNSIKFDRIDDIVNLLRYCNELFPPGIQEI